MKEAISPEEEHSCWSKLMIFNWCKVLYKLEDDQMQKMNGTDYTLYLVFLRYAAWLCLVITLINLVIFFPLYASGDPTYRDKHQNWSSLNKFTFLDITANNGKCLFMYIFTLIVMSGLTGIMLVWYRKKYNDYRQRIDPVA